MAKTFTGLKLQGNLGRFGKTEICDMIGIYPMPDEKGKCIKSKPEVH
jgi:cilia- and flagella-associated protein 44